MAQIFVNSIEGVTDADLASGGTTLSGSFLADLPAVSGGDWVVLTIDPDEAQDAAEIVHVTAHTASATTATITRAQESTASPTNWVTGVKVVGALTKAAVDSIVSDIATNTADIATNASDLATHEADTANPHATPFLVPFSSGDVVIETKVGTGRLEFPFAATLVSATVTLGVAATGQAVIVDVNKNGTTMFGGTKPQCAAGATSGSPQAPTVSAIAIGDLLTVDIDQVGTPAATAGTNLTVILELRKA